MLVGANTVIKVLLFFISPSVSGAPLDFGSVGEVLNYVGED